MVVSAALSCLVLSVCDSFWPGTCGFMHFCNGQRLTNDYFWLGTCGFMHSYNGQSSQMTFWSDTIGFMLCYNGQSLQMTVSGQAVLSLGQF